MSRPALTHDGFLIPNAGDVSNPRMAEPDQIDFNTLAHARWGVIEGCLVTVAGSTAMVAAGLAIVNGNLVVVNSQSYGLTGSGSQDRFDLIAVDAGGTLTVIPGTPATDAVFPDPDIDFTVLATVFVPAGGGADFSSNVVDKRKFVQKSLLTKIDPASWLVQNRNGVSDAFTIKGDGTTTWAADTWLSRSAPATLKVHQFLIAEADVTAQGSIVSLHTVTAAGQVNGSNLLTGTSLPATATNGDVFQHRTSGRIYVWRNGAWQELATLASTVPVGTVIQSVESPANMTPQGWLPLDGRTVNETDYPSIFNLTALAGYISGTAPNRVMTLPDVTDRVLVGSKTSAGQLRGSNTVQLTTANLPSHNHGVTMQTGGGGAISASMGRAGSHSHSLSGGAHTHAVNDTPHSHNGVLQGTTPVAVVGLAWGGTNKIDALFNDRNHTYSVEAYSWIAPSPTGITISSGGSDHGHLVASEGDHDHVLNIGGAIAHVHPLTEQNVGSAAPVNILPAYMTVYTYLRT